MTLLLLLKPHGPAVVDLFTSPRTGALSDASFVGFAGARGGTAARGASRTGIAPGGSRTSTYGDQGVTGV